MTAALSRGRPFTGDERELLENTLELNRAEIVTAVEGLSDAQARQKRVPSLTTPISLIKHCSPACASKTAMVMPSAATAASSSPTTKPSQM